MKREIRSPTTGKPTTAEVVEIDEINERPIRVLLEDGSVLRMRLDIIEILRVDGEWDAEGHPLYSVKSNNLLSVLDSPKPLRRPDPGK